MIFLIKPFQTKNSLIDCLIGSGIFEDCINYGIKSSMKNFNYFVDALRNVVSKNPNNYVLDFQILFVIIINVQTLLIKIKS